MGLKKANDITYLSIFNGRLAKAYKTANANTETRTNKNGKEVHEEYFKALDGLLTGLDTKVHEEYGEQLLIYITAKEGKYCIQTNLDSRYGVNFLKTVPNIDLTKEIEFVPSEKKDKEGKIDQTVFIKQGDKALKRFYTKEQGELPEPKHVKGKRGAADTWDFSPVTDFLFDNALVPFRQGLKEQYPNGTAADDLPF